MRFDDFISTRDLLGDRASVWEFGRSFPERFHSFGLKTPI